MDTTSERTEANRATVRWACRHDHEHPLPRIMGALIAEPARQ